MAGEEGDLACSFCSGATEGVDLGMNGIVDADADEVVGLVVHGHPYTHPVPALSYVVAASARPCQVAIRGLDPNL